MLYIYPDLGWQMMPYNNELFYKKVKEEIEHAIPNVRILNNESFLHMGIRYIGITLPICWVDKKNEVQKYLYQEIKNL